MRNRRHLAKHTSKFYFIPVLYLSSEIPQSPIINWISMSIKWQLMILFMSRNIITGYCFSFLALCGALTIYLSFRWETVGWVVMLTLMFREMRCLRHKIHMGRREVNSVKTKYWLCRALLCFRSVGTQLDIYQIIRRWEGTKVIPGEVWMSYYQVDYIKLLQSYVPSRQSTGIVIK